MQSRDPLAVSGADPRVLGVAQLLTALYEAQRLFDDFAARLRRDHPTLVDHSKVS